MVNKLIDCDEGKQINNNIAVFRENISRLTMCDTCHFKPSFSSFHSLIPRFCPPLSQGDIECTHAYPSPPCSMCYYSLYGWSTTSILSIWQPIRWAQFSLVTTHAYLCYRRILIVKGVPSPYSVSTLVEYCSTKIPTSLQTRTYYQCLAGHRIADQIQSIEWAGQVGSLKQADIAIKKPGK